MLLGRIGVGERSVRPSTGAWDCTRAALRIAPSLAASEAGAGFLSGEGDATGRAAICPGTGDRDGTDFLSRPTASAGVAEFAFSRPILSLTEPTSGPDSGAGSIERGSAWHLVAVLASAAATAADVRGFALGVRGGGGGWEAKAIVAPCRAAESSREVNRWFEPAISPVMVSDLHHFRVYHGGALEISSSVSFISELRLQGQSEARPMTLPGPLETEPLCTRL